MPGNFLISKGLDKAFTRRVQIQPTAARCHWDIECISIYAVKWNFQSAKSNARAPRYINNMFSISILTLHQHCTVLLAYGSMLYKNLLYYSMYDALSKRHRFPPSGPTSCSDSKSGSQVPQANEKGPTLHMFLKLLTAEMRRHDHQKGPTMRSSTSNHPFQMINGYQYLFLFGEFAKSGSDSKPPASSTFKRSETSWTLKAKRVTWSRSFETKVERWWNCQ